MQDFEKLGAFYLGKTYDLRAGETRDELVLYDSRDLTTHAVIIGMTGSGKTGLGLGMLEEAAIDGIPVIAIDPKGDLGNLLLNFPELAAEEFEPWVNPQEAATGGATVAEFAEQQAGLWKQGLANWGQDGERVRRLRDAAEMAVYTPGSSAGIPVSVLRSFRAPPAELRADMDLFRERIAGTATGILALMGMEGDPLTSREHILIANLLEHAWTAGRDLDVPGLIAAIQQPPMERVGVLDVDTFYPPKERFGLAMKLNNLLAAPGFEAWMEGEPLDVGSFLYDSSGKPRISIFSIAHLSESERMFFVSMLLNEMVAWVRTQSGTTSLRAILYMDEVFGYLPPTANPPSKTPMLTLLKQARAYGLGVVLSTQNPVDLDYKALSNTGTWFIGRLQTERDKMRVLEGLEGAAAGGDFDKNRMEQILAGLGKRVFLLHNVHEDQPTVFHTRWALSYLAGPLTRQQIGTLMADRRPAHASAPSSPAPVATEAATSGDGDAAGARQQAPPIGPAGVTQFFLPDSDRALLRPAVLGAADVHYSQSRYGVEENRRIVLACPIEQGPVPVEWAESRTLHVDLDDLSTTPPADVRYAELPAEAQNAKNFDKWSKLLSRHLRAEHPLRLHRSATLGLISALGESERDFRIRLREQAREQRDAEVEKLRKKYASRIRTLQDRLRRSEQAVEREAAQAQQKKLDTMVSVGTAVLGAFFGRRRSGASRLGTAVKNAGRIGKETDDVRRAQDTVEAVSEQLAEMEAELQREVDRMANAFDPLTEELEEVLVKPRSSDIHIHTVALAWVGDDTILDS